MKTYPTSRKDKQIIEEAAHWAMLLDDGDLSATQRTQLAAWLRESPIHVRELLLTKAMLDDAGGIDPEKSISIESLLNEKHTSIHNLDLPTTPIKYPTGDKAGKLLKPLWRFPRPLVAATLLLTVTAITLYFSSGIPTSPLHKSNEVTYQTLQGEQRSLPLNDGSVIHLNTQSKLRVRFTENERAIDLTQGEAFFDVAHDANRPFRVHASGAIAEAIGTKFNVRIGDDDTEVTVIEGRVALSSISSKQEPIAHLSSELSPGSASIKEPETLEVGEEASLDISGNVSGIRSVNVETITAWQQRKLVFESTSLSAIASEFNRYNRVQIVIDSRSNREPHFSGVFDANDPGAFLKTLEVSGIATIRSRGPQQIVIQLPPGKG